jgi:amyloid beta precursor protein binding protein 1
VLLFQLFKRWTAKRTEQKLAATLSVYDRAAMKSFRDVIMEQRNALYARCTTCKDGDTMLLQRELALNFNEALDNVRCVAMLPTWDGFVQQDVYGATQRYSDEALLKDGGAADQFWLLARAVADFTKQSGGVLPVSASLPDMNTSTKAFLRLAELFQTKAKQDCAAVRDIVHALCKRLKLATVPSDAYITHFVRQCRFVRACATKSVAAEYDAKQFDASTADQEWLVSWDEPKAGTKKVFDFHWYMALRAAERFQSKHGRQPGACANTQCADDLKLLTALATELWLECKLEAKLDEEYLSELVRYGGEELHNVAAFLGGVAAQEALKLITIQHVIMNHTLLYNGLHGTADVFSP